MAREPMPAPRPLESPAVRRSALLAKMLEEQRQPTEIKGGYGELAARLLAQGITQFGANRADKAVKTERDTRDNALRASLLAGLGGGVPSASPTPAPVSPGPVGQGPVLANAIAPQPAAPAPIPNPSVPTPGPTMQGVMPSAPQAASPVAASAPTPTPSPTPAPAAPQSAPPPQSNTDGPTPQEAALIRQAINSGDPGQLAWAQQLYGEIQLRAAAPSEWKDVSVNGVQYIRDQRGNSRPLFGDEGVPEAAQSQTFVAGENNEYGAPAGTLLSRSPSGVVSVVNKPSEGYELVGGTLRPQRGGREDITSPSRSFQELSAVRQEIRPILDQATALQRAHNSLISGVAQRNGPGDVAAINGFQKLVDDGVVREGDVTTQLRAAGLEGGIAGLTAYLTSSGRLNDEIRDKMKIAGDAIFAAQNRTFQERALGYAPLVNRTFGEGAFDDILPPSTREAFGWTGPVPGGGTDRRAPSRPQGARPAARPSGNNGNVLRQTFTPEQAAAELRRRQGGR